MTTNTKKLTKKNAYTITMDIYTFAEKNGFALPEDVTFEDLQAFAENEITLLENKAAAAQKRAAEKKAEGDELRARILEMLDTKDYTTVDELVEMFNDPDITKGMITARLTQLGEKNGTGQVEKEMVTIEPATEGGKKRTASAYRRKA